MGNGPGENTMNAKKVHLILYSTSTFIFLSGRGGRYFKQDRDEILVFLKISKYLWELWDLWVFRIQKRGTRLWVKTSILVRTIKLSGWAIISVITHYPVFILPTTIPIHTPSQYHINTKTRLISVGAVLLWNDSLKVWSFLVKSNLHIESQSRSHATLVKIKLKLGRVNFKQFSKVNYLGCICRGPLGWILNTEITRTMFKISKEYLLFSGLYTNQLFQRRAVPLLQIVLLLPSGGWWRQMFFQVENSPWTLLL